MRSRLKSWLRVLRDRIWFHDRGRMMNSRVSKALALSRRRAGRADGLELKQLKTMIEVQWIARQVHPWDRNRAPMSVQKLYTTQCLEDAQTAIRNLFEEIPELEMIDLRVLTAASHPPVMAGIVCRSDLSDAVHDSPAMNLKALGVTFKMSGGRLEYLRAVEEDANPRQARG